MRILIVHCRYRTASGEHVVVERQVELLRSAGHEVSTLFFQNPLGSLAALGQTALAPWNRASAAKMSDAIDEFGPQVVHLHNTWFQASPSVPAALDDAGVPTVITLHNYRIACVKASLFRNDESCELCVEGSSWPAIRHRCYHDSVSKTMVSLAAQAVDRRKRRGSNRVYVAPSPYVAEVAKRVGIRPESVRVLPHCAPDCGPRSTPASDSQTLLYVGRLDTGKGIEAMLQAWARTEGDLQLDVVGDGPLRSLVEEAAGAGVHSLGWRESEEVRERMLSARALVFPSEWQEPFGLVLAESLAAGLPVIGSDVSAVRSILGPAGDLVYSGSDPAWLATAIERLDDDSFTDDLSKRSRQRYEAEFDPAIHVRRLEELYSEVIDRESLPEPK